MFLIWYADLDRSSAKIKKQQQRFDRIDDGLTSNMSGQVFSPMALSREVTELREQALEVKETLAEKTATLQIQIAELRVEQEFHKKFFWSVLVASALFFGLRVAWPYLKGLGELSTQSSSTATDRQQPVRSGTHIVSPPISETAEPRPKVSTEKK